MTQTNKKRKTTRNNPLIREYKNYEDPVRNRSTQQLRMSEKTYKKNRQKTFMDNLLAVEGDARIL